jgi:hypothetical protein
MRPALLWSPPKQGWSVWAFIVIIGQPLAMIGLLILNGTKKGTPGFPGSALACAVNWRSPGNFRPRGFIALNGLQYYVVPR